jgi:hypothetical protein
MASNPFLRNRWTRGPGRQIAPRTALQPGVVTRREWLRFLSKVELGDWCQCAGMQTPHRHWLWGAFCNPQGYGRFAWRGRVYHASRFACIALGRAIPETWEPDHLCRVRHCCQPLCLEPVTRQENTERYLALQRHPPHCHKGHAYVPDNTIVRKDGYRRCRICCRLASRASKAKCRARRQLQLSDSHKAEGQWCKGSKGVQR